MIVSRCCNEDVFIEMRENESWYECRKCHLHCEVKVSFLPDYEPPTFYVEPFDK